MGNASRHGGSTTLIRFSVEEIDGIKAVVCEDDGHEISASMKKMMFARGTGKNQGFGLFLSHEILSIPGAKIAKEGKSGM